MVRIALCGAAGRMGTEIGAAVEAAEDLALVGAIERRDHPRLGETVAGVRLSADLRAVLGACDLVVDFTRAEASLEHLEACAAAGVGFVTGTTGFDDVQTERLRAAAARIPLLWASNMSLGVTTALELAPQVARRLSEYDVEIVEMHHRHKRDAPSGTAVRLAEALAQVRRDLRAVHGRHGTPGPRDGRELGMHALRGGDVVGEHRIIFAGPGERLEIRHVADHRGCFVAGALAAVRFLAGRDAGLYDMRDVVSSGGAGR